MNRELIALGVALICAVSLMGLPQEQKYYLAEKSRSSLLGTCQWMFSRVIRYTHDEVKGRFLLAQNAELALDNMRLREEAWENVRLRQALEFRHYQDALQLIPAQVISRDPDNIYDTIVINAGRNRGIEGDWPVVMAEGLVGHVAQVGDKDAVVQLLMRSPVSALVQETRAQGIVFWMNGNRFQLRFVEAGSPVKKGSHVVSSGLGGRYPKGLPIGVVVEVRQPRTELLLQEVVLESSVDFLNLEEVFVLRPQESD